MAQGFTGVGVAIEVIGIGVYAPYDRHPQRVPAARALIRHTTDRAGAQRGLRPRTRAAEASRSAPEVYRRMSGRPQSAY